MAAEPLPVQPWAEPPAGALNAARKHLERLGYRVLATHTDRRTGARLVVARSADDGELLLCELRAESVTAPAVLEQAFRRQRLRRAAAAWLAAHPQPAARALRLDRLTVIVGHDSRAIGIEHHPDAF
jgi:Holliday junction resolvase-like predicted endonuclease